jgi:GNAT superfamily N-acetyltransferase
MFTCLYGNRVIGFLTIKRHNQFSAENHIVGVLPECHRQGIGKALLARAEEWLRSEGIEFLQVKTQGPSRPDLDYEKTRQFYEAVGFRPLEAFPTLWGETLPCLLMVKKLAEYGFRPTLTSRDI